MLVIYDDCYYFQYQYAECQHAYSCFTVYWQSAIMLSAILSFAVMLIVIRLIVILPSAILVNIVNLVALLSDIVLSVMKQSAVILIVVAPLKIKHSLMK